VPDAWRVAGSAIISAGLVLAGLAALRAGQQGRPLAGSWLAAADLGIGFLAGAAVVAIGDGLLYGQASPFAYAMVLGAATQFYLDVERNRGSVETELAIAREVEARRLDEARIALLSAQLEPHFLFNTLAHLRRMIEERPDDARRMTDALSMLFRRTHRALMQERDVTVEEELGLVTSYLEVMGLRLGARLEWSVEPDGASAVRVPPLMVLTLVENAVRHGIERLREGGRIDVRARSSGGTLAIEVADNGAGFPAVAGGEGCGLSNLRARLKTRFGDRARLTLLPAPPHGVIARIEIRDES
jgi:LytS/YehU family sensor histidine kinase